MGDQGDEAGALRAQKIPTSRGQAVEVGVAPANGLASIYIVDGEALAGALAGKVGS